MEKVREIQYCKVKMELGIYENAKQLTITKVKESSDDCSISQLKYLLKDLKIQSTDISRVSNTTVLKDLVQMIGGTNNQSKPFQIFNQTKQIQKQFKPSQEAQINNYQKCQQTLKKKLKYNQNRPKKLILFLQLNVYQNQFKHQDNLQQIINPLELKFLFNHLENHHNQNQDKSPWVTQTRNTPQQNELLVELAKKIFSTKMTPNTKNQKQKALNLDMQQNFLYKAELICLKLQKF
ncbi:unnamed protein product [Paramecium pentaurelia]|uniref:Uncharacterized protein n=1 Tax=Paramecium pentaurelia TaxID=43138 RepID=A0A8S1VUZ7_9CILI|nr:unnamed protein product [Paramecium pentaurelia]